MVEMEHHTYVFPQLSLMSIKMKRKKKSAARRLKTEMDYLRFDTPDVLNMNIICILMYLRSAFAA